MFALLVPAAKESGLWVTSEQVRILRSLASIRQRGMATLIELVEPTAPPGVASRAHGLRLAVSMVVRAQRSSVHLRALKLRAQAHAHVLEASLLLEPGTIPLVQKTSGTTITKRPIPEVSAGCRRSIPRYLRPRRQGGDLPVGQGRGPDGGHRARRPARVPGPGAGAHPRPGPRHDPVLVAC